MPGDSPRSTHRVLSPPSKRRGSEALPAPMQPAAILAALQTDLERARAEYAVRSDVVEPLLEEIQKRIADSREFAPSELESDYALVEASLYTLKGRVLSHTDHDASLHAFRRAVDLFEKYRAELAQHSSSTRFWTDLGIALHRIGRNEDSIKILSKVCEGGVAPAEAFGYLGYSEWTRGNLQAAEEALKKGLEIAPTDMAMSFFFARVLDVAAKKIANAEGPKKAVAAMRAATEAYCRAGDIAWKREKYSLAGRSALRALRNEPANERALDLAVESYWRMGRDRLVLLIVERFLSNQPGNSHALGIKGVLLRNMGDQEGSAKALRAIPADYPYLGWVLAQLALTLSTGDGANMAEALEAAKRAVVLTPADPFVHRVLGLLEIDHGEYEAATSTLMRAKELGDTSEEVTLNLSRALMVSGNYARAEKELRAIVAANPPSVGAYFLLGQCAELLNKPERARGYYRKASRLAPDEPSVFVSLMNLLNSRDLRAQALDEIEGRLSGPLRYLALWYKAKFEITDEDWEVALRSLREALQAAEERDAREDLPGILVDYGDALRRLGKYENAKAAYNRAYEMDSSRQDVLEGKARYHCDVAEFVDAEACVNRALSSRPEDATQAPLWGLQGWCLQHLGDPRNAAEAYRKAFALSEETDPWYRKGLANALMRFDKEKAKEHFEAIVQEQKYQMDPVTVTERLAGDADTVALLGWCNYRLGRYDEAIRLLQTALDRSSDNQSVQFDLGLVFLASGRTGLARDAYLRGHTMTEKCEKPRQRGLYYIAMFDLADLLNQVALGPDSETLLGTVKQWLGTSGVAVEKLSWLANGHE